MPAGHRATRLLPDSARRGAFPLGRLGSFDLALRGGLPAPVGHSPTIHWPHSRPIVDLPGRVHLVYFGLYLLAAALVFRAPDLRNALQAIIQEDLSEGGGLLQKAGTAYLSGNIAWAALVTFAVNFFVGSVLVVTLPSCVIPGSGVLVAAFRAVLWGLILVPATLQQAFVMLPHSGTLLLEGEGYILAAFFGLMVPLVPASTPGRIGGGIARRLPLGRAAELKGMRAGGNRAGGGGDV